MAQAQSEDKKIEEDKEMKNTASKIVDTSSSSNDNSCSNKQINNNSDSSFKFNAQAPEFVPKSRTSPFAAAAASSVSAQMPVSGYYYPCFHYVGSTGGSDWFFLGDQHNAAAPYLISNPSLALPFCSNGNTSASINVSNNVLTDELCQKIIKQVEYQFSDMSLLANESMSKHTSKDPEGYVPISFIASTKKMKSLINDHNLLSQALKLSSKLVVSEDGKKVRRKVPFTEKDKEELQLRTVLVENLPDDHSHQNIEKLFSVVGSVKTIRICHPQESNPSRSKSDFFMSNKLHALVEFEDPEIAEQAVEKLNDERNWRKGLRVRLLLRCSPKSVLKNRKSEFESVLEEEETPILVLPNESSQPSNEEPLLENKAEETSGASKKGYAKGRGKGRGRGQSHGGKGLLSPSPQSATAHQCEAAAKPASNSKGPRMPDGTKGFTMGRGKPFAAPIATAAATEG